MSHFLVIYLCFILSNFSKNNHSNGQGGQEKNCDDGKSGNQGGLVGQRVHKIRVSFTKITRTVHLLGFRTRTLLSIILWFGMIALSRANLAT